MLNFDADVKKMTARHQCEKPPVNLSEGQRPSVFTPTPLPKERGDGAVGNGSVSPAPRRPCPCAPAPGACADNFPLNT